MVFFSLGFSASAFFCFFAASADFGVPLGLYMDAPGWSG